VGFIASRIRGIMNKRSLFVIVLFVLSCMRDAHDAPRKEFFRPSVEEVNVEVWVENLEIPWSLVFLSRDRALVSERPGRIRLIENGRLRKEPYAVINVSHIGEGGLMGIALHPEFPAKPYLYAMHTYRKGGKLYNRVIRLRALEDKAVMDKIIVDDIPGGRFHNGGRIAFGPDGMLYITTGEIFQAELAQDLSSLGGKILRVKPDGSIPGDNPFPGSPIYSYGHRNPQGIAWHPVTGDLFESEHGPSGEFAASANDEINVIVKGGNYGWPRVIGIGGKKEYIDPIVLWKEHATPPSGITFYRGDLFVATLRSQALIRIKLSVLDGGYRVERIERWFAKNYQEGVFGRIRDVVAGPDGFLYFLTNNRDGRGFPRPGDDKIYRIVPKDL
jgi:glucose/arabinose dehydrogenase